MKLHRAAVLGLLPVTFALSACIPSPTPPVDPESCRGTLGAVRVEKVIVPLGATCTLDGTLVDGTVEVERDATLISRGATIGGNVQATAHREVRLGASSTVRGSVQVTQGQAASVRDSRVIGDLQFDDSTGPLDAQRNLVGGSIQVVGNRGTSELRDNRVGGNLQCKENLPAPTGGGNVVEGTKEDQCRLL